MPAKSALTMTPCTASNEPMALSVGCHADAWTTTVFTAAGGGVKAPLAASAIMPLICHTLMPAMMPTTSNASRPTKNMRRKMAPNPRRRGASRVGAVRASSGETSAGGVAAIIGRKRF